MLAKEPVPVTIRVKDRNIFIAECKFWSGEKSLRETIDQLLGYLSWRDTKAAVIIFSRNRDFSGVPQTIQGSVPKHPHLRGHWLDRARRRFDTFLATHPTITVNYSSP